MKVYRVLTTISVAAALLAGYFMLKPSDNRVSNPSSSQQVVIYVSGQGDFQEGNRSLDAILAEPTAEPTGQPNPKKNCASSENYKFPWQPMANYTLTQNFGVGVGYQDGGKHTGIDIAGDPVQENGVTLQPPLYAVDNGKIIYVGPLYYDTPSTGRGPDAIVIQHTCPSDKIIYSIYSHDTDVEPWIREQIKSQGSALVSAGQQIARQGNLGYCGVTDSKGNVLRNRCYHLHFEVREGGEFTGNLAEPWNGGQFVNPGIYLRK